LGAITAGLLYVDFTNPDKFDGSIGFLIHEIINLWGDAMGKGEASPVYDWNEDDLISFVEGQSFASHSNIFKANSLNGRTFASLNRDDLANLGITGDDANEIIKTIEKLILESELKEAKKEEKKAVVEVKQQNRVVKSSGDGVSTHVNFKNNSSFVCEVFWIDFEGKEVLYNTLNPGDSYRQQTYVEHPWVVRDVETGDFMLVNGARLFFPDAEETIGVITGETREGIKGVSERAKEVIALIAELNSKDKFSVYEYLKSSLRL